MLISLFWSCTLELELIGEDSIFPYCHFPRRTQRNSSAFRCSVYTKKIPHKQIIHTQPLTYTKQPHKNEQTKEKTSKQRKVFGNGLFPKRFFAFLSQTLVFDFGSELYLWHGTGVSPSERKLALQLAQQVWTGAYDYSNCTINPLDPYDSNVQIQRWY